MGIKRLRSYLSGRFKTQSLENFKGKCFGIDGMSWLYKAFFSVNDDDHQLVKVPIVRRLEIKFRVLIEHGIRFVVVIDGRDLECKKETILERKRKREGKSRAKGSDSEGEDRAAGDQNVEELAPRELDGETIDFFIDYLSFKGYDFIVAPYEADAQLLWLYKEKKVDFVVSEDSDFFAMSCFRVVSDVRKEGVAFVFDESVSSLKGNGDVWRRFWELSCPRRLLLCIMAGCDYVQNIRGVGFLTLLQFFYTRNSLKDSQFETELANLIARRCRRGAEAFMQQVRDAQATYTNQLAYNPDLEKLVPLTPPEAGCTPLPRHTGAFFSQGRAYARGELDRATLKPRVPVDHNFPRLLGFVHFEQKNAPPRLSNLCAEPFSFENFAHSKPHEDDDRKSHSSHAFSDETKLHSEGTLTKPSPIKISRKIRKIKI